jgi:hypothetical protein
MQTLKLGPNLEIKVLFQNTDEVNSNYFCLIDIRTYIYMKIKLP